MTIVTLSPFAGAGAQFFDNNGVPLSAGLIYTYAAGTTTFQATYTNPNGNVQNANPIVLNASGRTTQEIWLINGLSYKFVLTDANSNLIGTYDNIPSNPTPAISNDASSIAYEQGSSTTAGSFIVGETYLITSIGTTNFTTIGAVSNTVGIYFTATGVGSGTGTAQLSRTVQNRLQEITSVLDFGADPTGATDSTTAINNALAVGGCIFFPSGTYLVGSNMPNASTGVLFPISNSVLFGEGGNTIIKLGANSTIQHWTFYLTNVSNVVIRDLTLNGNYSQQTGLGDIYSTCISIVDGSSDITVEHCNVYDAIGYGILVGYQNTTSVTTQKVFINNNYCHGNKVQQIAVTHGNEITISNNRVNGAIDIEPNPDAGSLKPRVSAIKIIGNTGVVAVQNGSVPQVSNLLINLYKGDDQGYGLNDISIIDNTVYSIACQYGYGIRIIGNTLIGSNSTQTNLLSIRGSQDIVVNGNNFISNSSVATALTCCFYQYVNNVVVCTGNTVDSSSNNIPFQQTITGTLGSVTSNPIKLFNNNNSVSGTINEVAQNLGGTGFSNIGLFRLDVIGSATPTFTVTQLMGQVCNVSASLTGTYQINLTSNRNDAFYEMLPICNVGTAGANVYNFVLNSSYETYNPSTQSYASFNLYTTPVDSTTITEFNPTTTNGTFYFRAYY